jgi:FkbM family methyltransferase
MLVQTLRRLRHGPLKMLEPFWLLLGKLYRQFIRCIPGLKTKQYVNRYGPFSLDAKFTFSNFENWGHGHNEGFVSCIEECRGKRCVFDIGAHIGLVTLPMSQVVAGEVYAFEPATANRNHLQHHLRYNKITNVKVQSFLVGIDTHSKVEFFEQPQATGMNSRVLKKNHHLYEKVERDQVSLDDFCLRENITPDVIKIDVEGAEYDVLVGAEQTLKNNAPVIYLSIHPKELSLMGQSVDKVINYLSGLNYFSYDDNNCRIDTFGFSEYRFAKRES